MTELALRKEGFLSLPVDGFEVPRVWFGEHVRLVPASPQWVELDHAAVIASRAELKHLFGPGDDWPPEDLSLAEDRADLAWHEEEFQTHRSFAYHLLSHHRRQCLGCLYIYPTASLGHDAEAYLWTHSRLSIPQARRIEEEVIEWVAAQWPFSAVAWPGRFIPFQQWATAGLPNYYVSTRMASASGAVEHEQPMNQ